MTNEKTLDKFAELRRLAEAEQARLLHDDQQHVTEDMQARQEHIIHLVHELQVHQIELSMQHDELQRTQALLQQSHDRYADLYHNAPVGHLTTTCQGQILEMNHTAARMLGETTHALLQQSLQQVIEKDDQDIYYLHLRHLQTAQTSHTCELRMQRQTAPTPFYVRLESTTTRDEHGALCCRTAMVDITEQKQAEADVRTLNATLEQRVAERTTQLEDANDALLKEVVGRKQAELALRHMNRDLQRSRDLMHTIINGIGDGLLLLDHTGAVLEVNQTVTSLFGATPEMPDTREGLDQLVTRNLCKTFLLCEWAIGTLEDGQPLQRRERFTRPDGTTRIFDMRALPIIYSADEVDTGQVLLHIVDVTESLRLEALMLENEQLNTARKLTEIVAHEINTPLQSIISSLDIIQQANKEKRTSYLALLEQEIERIGTILHHLKDTYHPIYSEVEPVDVNNLVQRVLLLTGGKMAKLHIQVETSLDTGVLPVRSRSGELIQVVLNIVVNAIEAMPRGGRLYLCTSIQGANVLLEIRDTGCGIEPEKLPHIFEPFFTTKEGGSGLGLFVCHNIVTRYDGTLTVQSQPGEGTRFYIMLPTCCAS
jgi:PAS domain S-box-containing protein